MDVNKIIDGYLQRGANCQQLSIIIVNNIRNIKDFADKLLLLSADWKMNMEVW